jgi:predicted TIM-barrel fold metal-dependent hydrolase
MVYYGIIDFHAHLNPSLETQMRQNGIEKAVLLLYPKRAIYTPKGRLRHLKNEEIFVGNEEVIKAANLNNAYVPTVWMSPKIPYAAKELKDYVERGCKILKLHPVLDNYSLINSRVTELLDTAAHLKIPVMIHTGWRPKGNVNHIGILADSYNDVRFIVAHMKEEFGVNRRLSHIKVASKHDNMWLETSYAEHPRRIAEAVKQLGSDRLYFGSDTPYGDIGFEMSKITMAPITDNDKRKILRENALQLLNSL